jgi:hypothetical protein
MVTRQRVAGCRGIVMVRVGVASTVPRFESMKSTP